VNDVAQRAFRRHYGQVYRYVRRRTRDDDRAEELTQQVFADAAASLRETGSPVLAWLYTVTKRRFADEARRAAQASAAVPAGGFARVRAGRRRCAESGALAFAGGAA
jgi:DNA-directed RNA polymerase specialized sigma24 family protein